MEALRYSASIERSNMVKICNGIMFNFYLGLPHMYVYSIDVAYVPVWLFVTTIQLLSLVCHSHLTS